MTKHQELSPGDLITTSYNSGPYRVVRVDRDCTCPNYLDQINDAGKKLPPAPSHIHITGVGPDTPEHLQDSPSKSYWLNRYLEEKDRIVSVDSKDEIFIVGKAKGQMTLF